MKYVLNYIAISLQYVCSNAELMIWEFKKPTITWEKAKEMWDLGSSEY